MKSLPALIPSAIKEVSNSFQIDYSNINKELVKVKGYENSANVSLYFDELSRFIDRYFDDNCSLNINLCLDYFNMLTTRHLFKLIQQLNKYQRQGKSIEINWECSCSSNNVDMLDMGLDFALMCDFGFFITIK